MNSPPASVRIFFAIGILEAIGLAASIFISAVLFASRPSRSSGDTMKRLLLLLLLSVVAGGACARHKPVVDSRQPYAAEQTAARDRVEARGRYDVNHNPNDTMSINSMGSD
jgi:hypothetical protein